MPVVLNKFSDYRINPHTEILILGTFTHPHPNNGEIYFSRPRIFLWHMLPICFKQKSLQNATLAERQAFMNTYRIDFADIILSLETSEGEEEITDDDFIDTHIHQFAPLLETISQLPNLKAVYFTRKTFNGIANIKVEVQKLARYCADKGIRFCKLDTPARHFSDEKQKQWMDTIIRQKTCLRV